MSHSHITRRGQRRAASGFTLVEILIVVVILGILAAIVIPQFGQASTDARISSMTSQLQTINSQLTYYKMNHSDTLPDLINNGWTQLTEATNSAGTTTGSTPYGPYFQTPPVNPLTNSSTIAASSASPSASAGWFFDAATGVVHGANSTGTLSDDGN